jgi:HrpA-like RNA helicase
MGWEAAEAAAAEKLQNAAASAREAQVSSVLSSLAAASLNPANDARGQDSLPVEAAKARIDPHPRSSAKTSQLIRKWESQCRSPQFAAMIQQRRALPAWAKRAEIIAAFNSSESRVFLVQASETTTVHQALAPPMTFMSVFLHQIHDQFSQLRHLQQ